VAVSPDCQGQGIGAALVLRWLAETHSRGARGCYLTTDADRNEHVNRFYQNLGWKLESSYTTNEGRPMNRYVFDFAASFTPYALDLKAA
jgi:GNAT superfamily N-acetyltransferase